MKTIDFNVNHEVMVKLTDYGRDKLRRDYDEMMAAYPKLTHEYSAPKEDNEGYSKWQLHSLMSRLGGFMLMGGDLPFETEIKIIIN